MPNPIARRRFLLASLASGRLSVAGQFQVLSAASPSPKPVEGAGLTAYQLGPQIWVRWNNRLLTCYRAHRSQKYPYLYPVSGPVSGLSLTAETALPWPHHRSLFFGCDRVNGGNYWQEEFSAGQILSAGPKLGQATPRSVEIRDACEWQKPGELPVMRDERKITVVLANARLHFIDWEIQWTALQDVTVAKTNHSLFAARAAIDLTPLGGGQLVNADGQSGEKATFGKPSAWCDFYGRRENLGADLVEGLAILDHPRNPWPQAPWFTRDYGFLSATPFNFINQPWKLPARSAVTLRYRVVLHAGNPKEAELDRIYREWAAS